MRLAAGGSRDPEGAARLQMDVGSRVAARLLPLLLARAASDDGTGALLDLLRRWPTNAAGDPLFAQALEKYFDGLRDPRTLERI